MYLLQMVGVHIKSEPPCTLLHLYRYYPHMIKFKHTSLSNALSAIVLDIEQCKKTYNAYLPY